MKKKAVLLLATLLIIIASIIFIKEKAGAPSQVVDSKQQKTQISQSAGFDKSKYSTDQADSLWVIVNKPRAISPIDYVPTDLIVPDVPLRLGRSEEQMHIRKIVEQPMKDMFAAAKQAGFSFSLGSGYRSYKYQKQLYDGYVASMGQAEADRISARPGHSEHQTGLAFDVEITDKKCHLDKCLGDTPDGKWIAVNAYKYGFIVRYQSDTQPVTGYDYEPWHLRYIGPDLTNELHQQNIKTLEEFFGVPGGPNY